MAVEVDKIVVQLEANVNDYTARISEAQRVTDQKLDAIERKGIEMGQSLKKSFSLASAATSAFIATIAVDKVLQMVRAGLEYASSLGETAQQLGVTTDALQELRYAGQQQGITQESMDASLAKLTKTMGEAAAGGKTQAAVFADLSKKIGVDILRSAKDAGDAIPLIADALAKIPDPAARARIETELFGRAGQKLDTLLAGGSAAVNALRDAAHDLGIVLSEKELQDADKLADKLAELKMVLTAKISGAVLENANAIRDLASAFGQLAGFIDTANDKFKDFQTWFRKYTALRQAENGLTPGVRQQGKMNYQDALASEVAGGQSVSDFVYGKGRGPSSSKSGFQREVVEPKGRTARGGGSRGRSGPSDEDIAHRFDAERAQIMEQYNRALGSMATSAEEEAEIELRSVELARIRSRANIEKDKNYSDAQKQQLGALVDQVAEVERESVERQKAARLLQERTDYMQADADIQRGELESARDAAKTQVERRAVGQALIDLEYEIKKQLLEQTVASATTTDAMKKRAQLELDNLPGQKSSALAANVRDTQSPLDKYLADSDPAKNGERAEQLVADELDHVQQGITSALTKAIGTDDPLITGLINMLLQEVLFRPLAEALKGGMGGLGGGGGILGGLVGGIGHIFGFASGGSMTIGGRGGNDNNTLSLNGRPIANVQRGETLSIGTKALSGRTGGQTIISSPQFDLRGAVVTSQLYADMERISRANAAQASSAMGQAVIKAVPKRMDQFNRDGT